MSVELFERHESYWRYHIQATIASITPASKVSDKGYAEPHPQSLACRASSRFIGCEILLRDLKISFPHACRRRFYYQSRFDDLAKPAVPKRLRLTARGLGYPPADSSDLVYETGNSLFAAASLPLSPN